nr:PAS domain-containing sensor histidine kinase [Sphingomonas populi]
MSQPKRAIQPNHEDFDWLESSLPRIFWIAGADGKMRFLSKGFTDLTGLDASQVINGDRWKDVVYPEDLGSLEALWRNARAGACESRSYFRMRLRTGDHRWMHSIGRPVFSTHSGSITHWVGGLVDVDNEFRAHRSIAQMNRDLNLKIDDEADPMMRQRWRFRSLFHDRRIGVIEIDAAGVKTELEALRRAGLQGLSQLLASNPGAVDDLFARARTIEVNRTLARMLGFEDADACLLGHRELFRRLGSKNPLRLVVQAMFTGEDTLDGVTDLTMADGQEVTVAYAINISEDLTCYATFVDITAQQRSTELRLAVQSELAQASRSATIGALSICFAHELDQPLTSMRLELQALEHTLSSLGHPSGAVGLQRVARQCERLSQIIHRTRDRVLSHRRSVELIDLVTIAEGIPLLLQREIKEGAVHFEVARPSNPCLLEADAAELQQVLVNLVLNAIEAVQRMPPCTRRVCLKIDQDDSGVRVQVIDTGPGIQGKDFPQIFDPFFTTKQSGVGMGLPICRTLVETMGGDLQARNVSGGGSIFEFWLPR